MFWHIKIILINKYYYVIKVGEYGINKTKTKKNFIFLNIGLIIIIIICINKNNNT